MRIDQLKYLIVLAESSSIIEASEKLHLSHQVLGAFLKKAEEEFGMEIFKRSKKGIEVTKEGQKVIGFAYETLQKYNKICAKEKKSEEKTILYTTSLYSICILPHIMRRFTNKAMSVYSLNLNSIMQKFNVSKDRNHSIGLINFNIKEAEKYMATFSANRLVYQELLTSERCYFVRKDSKFTKKKVKNEEEIPVDQLVLYRNFLGSNNVNEEYSTITDSYDVWLEHILRDDKIGRLYDLLLIYNSPLSKHLSALNVIRSNEPFVGSFGIIYAEEATDNTKELVKDIAEMIKSIKN